MALISLGSNKITSTKRHKTAPYIPRERERGEDKKARWGEKKGVRFSVPSPLGRHCRTVGWLDGSKPIHRLACLRRPTTTFFLLLPLPSSSPRAHHDGKEGRHLGISRLRFSPSLLSRSRERRARVTEIRRRRPRDRPPRLFLDRKRPPPASQPFPPPTFSSKKANLNLFYSLCPLAPSLQATPRNMPPMTRRENR